jgi:uncharacterized membrane protein
VVPRLASRVIAASAAVWVAILVATPVALAHGYGTAPALIFEACGLICHQRPERSFHLAGVQLPVCARCLGLYASGAMGAVIACVWADRGRGEVQAQDARWALAIAAVPTALTLGCEWIGLWHPSGAARALAAIPLGAMAGWVLVRTLAAGPAAVRTSGQVRYHS